MRQSPGDEKMQEVGSAIRQGALAYLRQQIATMSFFIVLLFCGLVGLFWRLGPTVAFGVGACFVAGVISSYISGFAGMLMAVNGNMRTANAAIKSPKLSLVTAFRSGAVAGMVTIGLGLLGATLIVLLFPTYATNLLVGYGFGASLAALFMRVGGGIFTKAADVGADLVGKVEAGIPEDDPRNPATIADNVGDNVGDCAGMAADVFESYEVTLVACIVLAAATAAVFDSTTWPRLIIFALGVCALGLFSSIVGVQFLKGDDDPNKEALVTLNRGFNTARLLAWLFAGGLAFLLLGGVGTPLQTSRLVSTAELQKLEIQKLQGIQRELATKSSKEPYQITADQVLADPSLKDFEFDSKADVPAVTSELSFDVSRLQAGPDLSSYSEVKDLDDPNNPALQYAVQAPPSPSKPGASFITLGQAIKDAGPIEVVKIHQVQHIPPEPAKNGMPARPGNDLDVHHWFGPVTKKTLEDEIAQFKKQVAQNHMNMSVDVEKTYPVSLYTSPDGGVAYAIDGEIARAGSLRASDQKIPSVYYKASVSTVQTLSDANASAQPGKQSQMPPQGSVETGVVSHAPVPWWTFWLMITFGIAMVFGIEYITDYFVSTRKAPTREVAGVATAGAAPMVIQGFAHALTSSVFMVAAIVVALLFPMFVFNPANFGGSYVLSFFGIALVGVGLLSSTAFVLAMDTFGPISDNAQGVFEMSGAAEAHPEAAAVVARLDAAGNTTKALTKGFAIATAVVAAVALFHSYLEGAHLGAIGLRLDVPEIFLGLLIGGAAPYLFSAFAIQAVGRSSFELINEVRRQFRGDPGIMKGTSKPDYGRCVAIVTAAAQKELLGPGVLAIALPIAVGFGFSIGKAPIEINGQQFVITGAQALGGFLAGAIVSGQLMAVLLANAGGMWDNAKKLIEDGFLGGKGTDAHKAAVVCDTIGDPFKDTAGPALNPLIKVMNLVGLLISGVIILPMGDGVRIAVTVICLAALIATIMVSRKGSMSSAMESAVAEAPVVAVEPEPEPESLPEAKPTSKKKLFVEEDPKETVD
jgi:K(+)-stimulated pyrophosphate-energized sodium pump